MREIEELEIRVAIQIASLGMISSDIRSISFDFVKEFSLLKFRVNFSGQPHEQALENMSCILTEVEAGLPIELKKIEEEYLVTPVPTRPVNLSKVVYARCESSDFLQPA